MECKGLLFIVILLICLHLMIEGIQVLDIEVLNDSRWCNCPRRRTDDGATSIIILQQIHHCGLHKRRANITTASGSLLILLPTSNHTIPRRNLTCGVKGNELTGGETREEFTSYDFSSFPLTPHHDLPSHTQHSSPPLTSPHSKRATSTTPTYCTTCPSDEPFAAAIGATT